MTIPKHLYAISCYFCRHYFLIGNDVDEQKSMCSKHDFTFSIIEKGFSSLFSRCEDFEEYEGKR
jgi:hypothetical protein